MGVPGSVQNLSHFRLAERHPALAHAVMGAPDPHGVHDVLSSLDVGFRKPCISPEAGNGIRDLA